MSEHRVLHLSDLHLSGIRPHNLGNWEVCLAAIERAGPDLVVLGGDMVLDDPDIEEDHAFARAQVGRITAPWRAIPGNHDVGDTQPKPYKDQPITAARRARYLGHYGEDRWCVDLGRWRLIGLNDLLFASDLDAEREQFAWLEQRLAEWRGRPVALFLHKPLCLDVLDEDVVTQSVITPGGRRRLLAAIADSDVRLIGSGHTHRYRSLLCGGLAMVWSPTIGHVNHNFQMPRGGIQRAGWIAYTFREDGVEWQLVQPPELPVVDITELSARYGAMRFVPPELSTALMAQSRIEPIA
jgi:3',5'-cyclic AMP phosphodiesterase CpdA